ncbi:4'-phosphopantetheinyl transferase superfamily protein [Deltaproteobacteria bacterium TL4]
MFQTPFPETIRFHCQRRNPSSPCAVLPEELECIQQVTSVKRRWEFILGRHCAHQALGEGAGPPPPILKDPKTREPLWPAPFIGSITHAEDWGAAAVGRKSWIRGVGLDIESVQREINPRIERIICVDQEREWLSTFSGAEKDYYLKLIFSAKESIFKCFYPQSRVYLGFHDACVTLAPSSNGFEFTLFKACGPSFPVGFRHQGNYQRQEHLILTAIYV